MKFQEWIEEYKPLTLQNPADIYEDQDLFEEIMGYDLMAEFGEVPEHFIWTVCSMSDENYIIAGRHFVNSMFKVVTFVPWDDNDRFESINMNSDELDDAELVQFG